MQTSDQSPDKNMVSGETTQEIAHAASTPVSQLENIQDASMVQPATQRSDTDEVEAAAPRDEDILKGLVYPPPPSFYLKPQPPPKKTQPRPEAVAVPQIAPAMSVPIPQPPYGNGSWSAPGNAPFVTTQRTSSMQQPLPAYYPTRPDAKKSHTWVWMLVCALIVVLLGSCGLIAWVGYSLFGAPVRSAVTVISNGQEQANSYFDALQAKNYTLAYSYISPQGSITGLTQDTFIKNAQQQDQQYGPVQSYNASAPSVTYTADGGVANFSIAVDVSRPQEAHYKVTLFFHQVGTSWKIVDFDKI